MSPTFSYSFALPLMQTFLQECNVQCFFWFWIWSSVLNKLKWPLCVQDKKGLLEWSAESDFGSWQDFERHLSVLDTTKQQPFINLSSLSDTDLIGLETAAAQHRGRHSWHICSWEILGGLGAGGVGMHWLAQGCLYPIAGFPPGLP